MKTAGLLGALFIFGWLLVIAGVEARTGDLFAVLVVPDELVVTK
jgi:hypothetical protein